MIDELKITIKIDTINDAFQPDPRPEVSRILQYLSHVILQDGLSDFKFGPHSIRDINGNRVGEISLIYDMDDMDDSPEE
ncbi:hypothetical protein [Methylocystis sp. ATCC 49242]|uniref:hypothetical protein n=1 Tax=Methylocystis sp. ATCC 49242 TaxID=622637 RepID=UPI0001F870FB|nr:hypothetical protein [Methylocystis sp. ATCC 49242]